MNKRLKNISNDELDRLMEDFDEDETPVVVRSMLIDEMKKLIQENKVIDINFEYGIVRYTKEWIDILEEYKTPWNKGNKK